MVIEVSGYFTGDETASSANYHALTTPTRIVQAVSPFPPQGKCPTTSNQCVPVAGLQSLEIQVTGQGGLPATDIDAVVINLFANNPNSQGFLLASAKGSAPGAISLAYQANTNTSGNVTVPIGDDGRIVITNFADSSTSTGIVIDVQGYFASSDTITYTYDGNGLRTSKTASHTGTSTYTWSAAGGLPLLLTENNDGINTHLIYGPGGMPLGETTGTPGNWTTHWLHHDQLGSTRLVTNTTGNTVGTYTYDPYGAPADSTGSYDPLLDYAGQYTDQETGFQYLRARYYDPETAQFLTRDPLLAVTMEPYAYAGSDPVNGSDPSGRCSVGAWVKSKTTDLFQPLRDSCKEEDARGGGRSRVALSMASAAADQAVSAFLEANRRADDATSTVSEHVGVDATVCAYVCVGLTYLDGQFYWNTGLGAIGAAGIGPTIHTEPLDKDECNPSNGFMVGPFSGSVPRDPSTGEAEWSNLSSVGIAWGIPSLFLGEFNQRPVG